MLSCLNLRNITNTDIMACHQAIGKTINKLNHQANTNPATIKFPKSMPLQGINLYKIHIKLIMEAELRHRLLLSTT